MDEAKRGGLQFSVRMFLLVTAAVALLLVPVAWVAREGQQLMRAQQEILLAREVALRSVVREQQRLLVVKRHRLRKMSPRRSLFEPGLNLNSSAESRPPSNNCGTRMRISGNSSSSFDARWRRSKTPRNPQASRDDEETLLFDQILPPSGCTMFESGAPSGCSRR